MPPSPGQSLGISSPEGRANCHVNACISVKGTQTVGLQQSGLCRTLLYLGEVCGEDGGGSGVRPSHSAVCLLTSPGVRDREYGRGQSVVIWKHYSFTLGSCSLELCPSPCSGDAIPTILVNTCAFP